MDHKFLIYFDISFDIFIHRSKVAAKTSILEMKRNAINSLFDTIIGAKRSLAGGIGNIGGGFPSFGGLKLGGSTSSSSANAGSIASIDNQYIPPQQPQFIASDAPHHTTWIVTEQRVPIRGPIPHFDTSAIQQVPVPVPHDSYGPPAASFPTADPLYPSPLPLSDEVPAPNCTH